MSYKCIYNLDDDSWGYDPDQPEDSEQEPTSFNSPLNMQLCVAVHDGDMCAVTVLVQVFIMLTKWTGKWYSIGLLLQFQSWYFPDILYRVEPTWTLSLRTRQVVTWEDRWWQRDPWRNNWKCWSSTAWASFRTASSVLPFLVLSATGRNISTLSLVTVPRWR